MQAWWHLTSNASMEIRGQAGPGSAGTKSIQEHAGASAARLSSAAWQ